MTALKEFQRLESTGIWRASPDAQRRDVIVAIGDATLVISDQKDTALSHWSLPAVERVNPGETPAIFRPGPDASETLELDDPTMTRAIGMVHTAIERRRPHPGRLRNLSIVAAVTLVACVALLWLPGALISYTATVVPTVKRAEIGDSLLRRIRRVSGPACNNAPAQLSLSRLAKRLSPDRKLRLVVLPAGVAQTTHLPGGIILINRALVEDYEDPEVVAGFILAETQRTTTQDPLKELLQQAGLVASVRLLTTGNLPERALDAYAETLLTAAPYPTDRTALLARFRDAKVRTTPYAYALDISGETTIALIEADPVTPANASPVLNDSDWVTLQGICGE